jgi:hypothetical protein
LTTKGKREREREREREGSKVVEKVARQKKIIRYRGGGRDVYGGVSVFLLRIKQVRIPTRSLF